MSLIVDNPSDPKNGLLQQVHSTYKGNTNFPAWGSVKSTEYLMIANRLLDQWAQDADVKWDSLWQDYRLNAITDVTKTAYTLAVGILELSDWVNIILTTGEVRPFQVLHPNRRNDTYSPAGTYGSVYLTGNTDGRSGNMTLNFTTALGTSTDVNNPYVGGIIEFGGYTMPTQYTNQSDKVLIDSPTWLIWATATELARNDPSRQDQVAFMSGMAADAYKKMVTGNQGNSSQQPNNPYGTMQQNTGVPAPVYGAG